MVLAQKKKKHNIKITKSTVWHRIAPMNSSKSVHRWLWDWGPERSISTMAGDKITRVGLQKQKNKTHSPPPLLPLDRQKAEVGRAEVIGSAVQTWPRLPDRVLALRAQGGGPGPGPSGGSQAAQGARRKTNAGVMDMDSLSDPGGGAAKTHPPTYDYSFS